MRLRFLLLGLVGLLAVLGMVGGSSAATPVAAGWGDAIQVPATTVLNHGDAQTSSISCSAAGSCSAGGSYRDASGHYQAFVMRETQGVWRNALEVPGTAALNNGGDADVNSVSCHRPNECAAGGSYYDGAGFYQVFVVSQKNGNWGKAIEVPGTATLNTGEADVNSVSCGAAGSCTAAGYYRDGFGNFQAFVVNEKHGVWRTAREVPGTENLNKRGDAAVTSVSCGAPGVCAAGGYYLDGFGNYQAFVVDETAGAWGQAVKVPRTSTLNKGGDAEVNSVSCGAAGECAAGGSYLDGSGHSQAFVVSETDSVWGQAVEVPGTSTLNKGGDAAAKSVSCNAAGDCAAGGFYRNRSGHHEAFVVRGTNGSWGKALEVPGSGALNKGGDAKVGSVRCGRDGNCQAGGSYRDGSGHYQAFVVSETGDLWLKAHEVPGTATLNKGGHAAVNSISCGAAGDCAAGGFYTNGGRQAFVVSSAPVAPPAPCVVPRVVGKTLGAAKKALAAANCGVGRVKKVYAKAKIGRVVKQSPKSGTQLNHGDKVALTLSKGKRKKK